MKGMLGVVLAIALTAICWGSYGPVLHWGQEAMGSSKLRPFICVGLAYFVIAVMVPGLWLLLKPEQGHWSIKGTIWSLAAGAAGAIGALGIIMAFNYGGSPLYVMPLVFGGAPVVNTFFTMLTNRSYKQAGPIFFAGLLLVIAGAATVLIFKPTVMAGAAKAHATTAAHAMTFFDVAMVTLFTASTALGWGVYGPVLHWGQASMGNSRLRPLLCVGLAYFLIAVLFPFAILNVQGETGSWDFTGVWWSLAAGSAGAIGALGIILAFAYGGRPIFVMPLVFGCAPVINTFTTILTAKNLNAPGPVFFAGLILVAIGAVVVLIFAPAAHKKPAPVPAT